MNVFFTIVAKNYMASAISLMKSLASVNVDAKLFIVLADRFDDERQRDSIPFDVLTCDEMSIKCMEEMAFMYDVVEFSTAIKPQVFNYFFEQLKSEKVVYMDPDTFVYNSISEVLDQLDASLCVLTPHLVDLDIVSSNHKESLIVNRGVFNFGFLGLRNSRETIGFTKWWAHQLLTECIRSETLFVDQKWGTFIPCYIPSVSILKNKKYNIADWNLHERSLRKLGDCVEVENSAGWERICFFHFSGIKQQEPDAYFDSIGFVGTEQEREALSWLIRDYEANLRKNGYDRWSKCHYHFNYFSDGKTISLYQRRLFRNMIQRGKKFSNPFEADSKWCMWLKSHRIYSKNSRDQFVGNNYSNTHPTTTKRYKLFRRIVIWFITRLIMIRGVHNLKHDFELIRYVMDIDNQLMLFETDN